MEWCPEGAPRKIETVALDPPLQKSNIFSMMAQSAMETGAVCMAFNFLPIYERDGSPSYRMVFNPTN